MNFPEDLKYSDDHEWVKVDGNIATIGISDHAQSELGDVVYVDIDEELAEVKAGEEFGTVEAVKTVAELQSPVSGKVMEIHSEINDKPELVNSDPYDAGWMIKVELYDMEELNSLMDANTYKETIGQ